MTTDTLARTGAARLASLARYVSADELVASLARRDQAGWASHVASAAGCAHPVRLTGTVTRVEQATGRITSEAHTASMPDGVLYTACGNRRATVCPSRAETYRADTFQLVSAGLVGGKGVPVTVATHPCVFLTVTAPSFGPVHAHRADSRGRLLPCRPRRDTAPCEHGKQVGCFARHDEDDPLVGRPLCLDSTTTPAKRCGTCMPGSYGDAPSSTPTSTAPASSTRTKQSCGSATPRSPSSKPAAPSTSTPWSASTAATPKTPTSYSPHPSH